MTRTRVLRTAYNKSMQPVFVLVLLMLMQQQPDFGASMQKMLAFYRENRALIAALTGGTAVPASAAQTSEASEPSAAEQTAHEKSRPAGDGPENSVLEEFLKRAAAH